MEYDKVLKECAARAELYRRQDSVWNLAHEEKCADAIKSLIEENRKAVGLANNQSIAIEYLLEQVDLKNEQLSRAIEMLHGKCPACQHYTPRHREGRCWNCCWDHANPACLREYQDDCWEWKGWNEA